MLQEDKKQEGKKPASDPDKIPERPPILLTDEATKAMSSRDREQDKGGKKPSTSDTGE